MPPHPPRHDGGSSSHIRSGGDDVKVVMASV